MASEFPLQPPIQTDVADQADRQLGEVSITGPVTVPGVASEATATAILSALASTLSVQSGGEQVMSETTGQAILAAIGRTADNTGSSGGLDGGGASSTYTATIDGGGA